MEQYEQQIKECKISLRENIDAYLLILPTELGCLPCQIFHSIMQSYKYIHINRREQQLISLKKQITSKTFCVIDIGKYVESMGAFNGRYGKLFYDSVTRRLENILQLFNSKLNIENDNCKLCSNYLPSMIFKCGHKHTCKNCEENRLYHICLECNKESNLEDIEFCEEEYVKTDECCVCYEDGALAALNPCYHANICSKCSNKVLFCPTCRTSIDGRIVVESRHHQKKCSKCNEAKSNILYTKCNHMASCDTCEDGQENNTCTICNQLSERQSLKEVYF